MSPRLLAPLALALLALPASAGFKDGVFTSEDHGLRFRLPRGSKVDAKAAGDGKVALFETADGKLKGVIRHGTEGLGASKHAKWRASEWEKKGAVVTWDSEEKVEGKDGEWLKVVLELEAGEEEMKSAHLFVSKGKDDFELGVMAKAGDWDGAGKDIEAILSSLEFGAFKDEGDDAAPEEKLPPPDGDGKTVLLPNPWEGCGKGSWVRHRMVSEANGTKTEIELTTTLVDFDDETYTLKSDMRMGENVIAGKEMKVNRRVPAPGADAPKPEEGDETIRVAKGEFACHWVRTAVGEGWSKSWTNAGVPGQMVKAVSEAPGGKSEMELLDFEKK